MYLLVEGLNTLFINCDVRLWRNQAGALDFGRKFEVNLKSLPNKFLLIYRKYKGGI